jgi:hypothetical protein
VSVGGNGPPRPGVFSTREKATQAARQHLKLHGGLTRRNIDIVPHCIDPAWPADKWYMLLCHNIVTNNLGQFVYRLSCIYRRTIEIERIDRHFVERLDAHCPPPEPLPHEDGALARMFDVWGGK